MTNQQPLQPDPRLQPPFPPPPTPHRFGPGQRAALYVTGGALTFVLLCLGGLTVLGTVVGTPAPALTDPPRAAGQQRDVPPPVDPATTAPDPTGSPTAAAEPTAPPSPTAAPTPVVSTRRVVETAAVPYARRTVDDPSLANGVRKVRTRGVPGVRTLTWEETLTGGVRTGRTLVSSVVTRQPVTEVVAVGTKQTRRCDPNYSGCVPVASDVDCAGGGGNGPAYVSGPVRVVGDDVYRLDADGDGYGCED